VDIRCCWEPHDPTIRHAFSSSLSNLQLAVIFELFDRSVHRAHIGEYLTCYVHKFRRLGTSGCSVEVCQPSFSFSSSSAPPDSLCLPSSSIASLRSRLPFIRRVFLPCNGFAHKSPYSHCMTRGKNFSTMNGQHERSSGCQNLRIKRLL